MTTAAQRTKTSADFESNWALLERIAASSHLRRATRLQELLLYIGRCTLKEGFDKISEQKIGVDIFGRPEGYDTSADNIVRTSVSELRKRIDAYFEMEGREEPLVMEIPRWSYIPVFTHRSSERPLLSEHPAADAAPAADHIHAAVEVHDSPHAQGWVPIALVAAGLITIVLAAGCVFFWSKWATLNHTLYAWKYEPSVSALWTRLLNASPETDVVLADASFGLLQDLNKISFPFDDYLNRSYIGELEAQRPNPEMQNLLNRIVRWNMGSQDEFKLARRILTLDPLGNRIHLYNARDYMPDLVNRDNVILIGGRISNPWDDLFESRMNFSVRFDNDGAVDVVNRAPVAGEKPIYSQEKSVQYCVIGYLPNPDHNGIVLLIEGTGAEATEAAGNFLLSEGQLSNFKTILRAAGFPYFEVLLKVSSVQGTPLTATIEAYRAYPNLH